MDSWWCLKDMCTGDLVEVRDTVLQVGRSSNFDIVCRSPNVSREHAKFMVEAGHLYVEDLNSSNGTFVNSYRIQSKIQRQLKHGDFVSLGVINFEALAAMPNDSPQYVFQIIKRPFITHSPNLGLDILDVSDDEIENMKTLHNISAIKQENESCTDFVDVQQFENIHAIPAIKQENESPSDFVVVQHSENSNQGALDKFFDNHKTPETVNLLKKIGFHGDFCSTAYTNNDNGNSVCTVSNSEMKVKSEKLDTHETTESVGYSVEDNVIVIDDDDDYEIASSQVFKGINSRLDVDENIYRKIKIELEELDALACNNNPILIDDSDSDDDWFSIQDLDIHVNSHKLECNLKLTNDINSLQEPSPGVQYNKSNYKSGDLLMDEKKLKIIEKENVRDNKNFCSSSSCLNPPVIKHLQEKFGNICVTNSNDVEQHHLPYANSKSDDVLTEEEKIKEIERKIVCDTKNSSSSTKYLKPPIIEPLQEKLCRTYRRKQESHSKTRQSIVPSKEKAQKKVIVKRKAQECESTANTKRQKAGGDADEVPRNVPKGRGKRKRSNSTTDNINKEEKEKIKELRKKKLKELETKNVNRNNSSMDRDKSRANKTCLGKRTAGESKFSKPHVKVSAGRGKFLLDFDMRKAANNVTKAAALNNSVVPVACSSKQFEQSTSKSAREKNFKLPEKNHSIGVAAKHKVVTNNFTNICHPTSLRNDQLERRNINNLTTGNNNLIKNTRRQMCNMNNNNAQPTWLLSFDVVLNFINWKTSWLEEQLKLLKPPPVNKRTPVKMCCSFSNHNDYCNIVYPLLMLELWTSIFNEWYSLADKTRQQDRRFTLTIEAVVPQTNYFLLKSLSYITREQKDTRKHVKEGDAILINVPLVTDKQFSLKLMYGYVLHSTKSPLKHSDFIDEHLIKQLPASADIELKLDIVIRCATEQICTDKLLEGGILTSMTSALREFQAVKALRSSPLCNFILDPKIQDYAPPIVNTQQFISKDPLCETQKRVVLEATAICLGDNSGIYLIQGPPGTGKTTVITNIVQHILLSCNSKYPRILLVAPTNAAIDGLVIKINKHVKPQLTESERRRFKLVRIGPQRSMHEEVKAYSLDVLTNGQVNKRFLIDFPEVKNDLQKLHKERLSLQSQIAQQKGIGKETKSLQNRLQQISLSLEYFAKNYLKHQYNEKFNIAKKEIVRGANIICTTLSSCVRLEDFNLSNGKTTCCIVDEATQSKEAETLIPLMLGIKRLVLVGDPQQLPAVTLSTYAKALGHGQSLFARIKHQFENQLPNPIQMLNVQYRMHPEISRFPSKNFYNGQLLNSRKYLHRGGLKKLLAYYVFNVNSTSNNSKNYSNNDEIECVVKLLDAIRNTVGTEMRYSVGIITPYNTQKDAFIKRLCTLSQNTDTSISINTVDGFQGLEKDVIILSCVRYSPNSFLGDEQRLNVAITRAKHALYIVGTYSLFQQCSMLSRIKRDAEERNLYININCSVNSSVLQTVIASK